METERERERWRNYEKGTRKGMSEVEERDEIECVYMCTRVNA